MIDLDLEIYVQPPRSWYQRWLWPSPVCALVEKAERSCLLVHQPRWPLRQLLFIMRADPTDWGALAWIERLARPGQTVVSILPVVPPWPRFHRMTPHAQPSPAVLLAPNTHTGAMIQQVVQRLRQQQLATTLSLAVGEPHERISTEIATRPPELIVIAAESRPRLFRWFCGELVRPLINGATCPLLVAK
ncbi:MAG: universal stress protein [Caldilineaceae bacterium]|nr:universal stress protein [Caldilineaceae bacterium]